MKNPLTKTYKIMRQTCQKISQGERNLKFFQQGINISLTGILFMISYLERQIISYIAV